jgi:ABC-type anion transport system duplicated permease subunit
MGGEDDPVRSLASIAYVVLGVLVASQHDYYTHLTTVSQVLSAVVATALWPLILLGASLHLNLGQL